FRAENLAALRSVTAVRRRVDEQLRRSSKAVQKTDRSKVRRSGRVGVPVAERRPDESCERHQDVARRDEIFDEPLVPRVAKREFEGRIVSEVKEGLRAEVQAVECDDAVPRCEKARTQYGTDIARCSGDENGRSAHVSFIIR